MTGLHIMPNLDEDKRAKTKNNMGFAHLIPAKITQAFYEHAKLTQGLFADIGAAYGFDSITAARNGAQVVVIDKEPSHLEALKNDLPLEIKDKIQTLALTFPEEANLEKDNYDGVLLSRILLFLDPALLNLALSKVFSFLKPGGKVFILSIAPFTEGWEGVTEVYLKQKEQGNKWPGYVTNLWDLVPKTKDFMPQIVQFLDEESLQAGLKEAGFIIEEMGYEPVQTMRSAVHVYAIAIKP